MTDLSRDRRQEIIDRLEALLTALTITLTTGVIPAKNFVHNREELGKDLVPGIILLDADEVNNPRAIPLPPGQQASQMRDQLVNMTPEIYVVLQVRKPQNKDVGKDLNTARKAIMAAIWGDPALWSIVGANGNIVCDGCVTDLARNRKMEGQLGLSVTFTYPLKIREIIGK